MQAEPSTDFSKLSLHVSPCATIVRERESERAAKGERVRRERRIYDVEGVERQPAATITTALATSLLLIDPPVAVRCRNAVVCRSIAAQCRSPDA